MITFAVTYTNNLAEPAGGNVHENIGTLYVKALDIQQALTKATKTLPEKTNITDVNIYEEKDEELDFND
jgi:hypothetical protein